MTQYDDRDTFGEEVLRRALQAATDGIEPGGDGLKRIRARLSPPKPLLVAWLFAVGQGVRGTALSWFELWLEWLRPASRRLRERSLGLQIAARGLAGPGLARGWALAGRGLAATRRLARQAAATGGRLVAERGPRAAGWLSAQSRRLSSTLQLDRRLGPVQAGATSAWRFVVPRGAHAQRRSGWLRAVSAAAAVLVVAFGTLTVSSRVFHQSVISLGWINGGGGNGGGGGGNRGGGNNGGGPRGPNSGGATKVGNGPSTTGPSPGGTSSQSSSSTVCPPSTAPTPTPTPTPSPNPSGTPTPNPTTPTSPPPTSLSPTPSPTPTSPSPTPSPSPSTSPSSSPSNNTSPGTGMSSTAPAADRAGPKARAATTGVLVDYLAKAPKKARPSASRCSNVSQVFLRSDVRLPGGVPAGGAPRLLADHRGPGRQSAD